MRTGRVLRTSAVLWLVAASLPAAAAAELDLAAVAREALEANLDLAARRRALAADREQIEIARSSLLPQIDLGSTGQILDNDRSDDSRGATSAKALTLHAGASQLIYDETDYANFQIQKYIYGAQTQQLEAFQLSVIGDAANAYLDLNRSRALVSVQERNRAITVRNIETSRARIAAGWSSETEILRWQSQLADDDSNLTSDRARVLTSQFELNRVRDRPREAPIEARAASVAEDGFVYARDAIARAVEDPEKARKLRDAMVRIALDRSPVLKATDEAIAAAERQLTANRRVFWIPTLTVGGGVNHLAADSSKSRDDLEETEWGAAASLTFPLFEGGAKLAELSQTREALSGLRFERRAQVLEIGQSVRAAFAEANGNFASLGFARDQQAAARRYFELTNDSYVLGVASIIRLLDAQRQLLDAELAVTNALYDFLETLIGAEQEIALFPFLEPEAEVQQLLDRLEQQLQ